MKLYTEEQVRSLLNKMDIIYSLEDLTPIELPSDDDIKENSPFNEQSYGAENCAFIEGAEWMKEQILNQNKLI